MSRTTPCYLAALLTALAFTGVTRAASLTAYYDFEDDGNRYNDVAGAFNDELTGQFNPAVSSDTPGAWAGSSSASFDGNSALYTQAYTSDLGPDPDAYTIMFWIKARDIEQENSNTRLMSTARLPDNSGGTPALYWQIEGFGDPANQSDPDGTKGDLMDIRLQNNGLGQNWFNPDATDALAREDQGETTAEWRHVAFVLSNSGGTDGGAYGQTYVDGSPVGFTDMNAVFDGVDIGNTLGQLIIGGDAQGAGIRAFTGLLDDLALWAGVVDAADILAIAQGDVTISSFFPVPVPAPSALPAGLALMALAVRRRARR